VTVKAVDMSVPSLTVVTAAGVTLTRKIADRRTSRASLRATGSRLPTARV
jgi:hypothetical protein